MTLSTPTLKNLRIQSSALKRTYKELSSYKSELKREQERLEKMKQDESVEKLRIKQQKDVVEECRVMIPNTKQRMDKSVEIVRNIMKQLRDEATEEELREAKEYVEAMEVYQTIVGDFPEYDEDRERKQRPYVD